MLLQTHLYYCSKALEDNSYRGEAGTLLYGVEKIHRLCEAWKRFFAPSMLCVAVEDLSRKEKIAWDDVMDTADALAILSTRTRELLEYRKSGNSVGISRRLSEVIFVLKDSALPSMRHCGYDAPAEAHTVFFDNTDRFLTSMVPIETVMHPSMVPGVFNECERAVIAKYLDILKSAPSIAEAAGVEIDQRPKYIWAEASHLGQIYTLSEMDAKMLSEEYSTRDLTEAIYTEWEQEFLRSKG